MRNGLLRRWAPLRS